jgi:diaminopimelate decarboxylase
MIDIETEYSELSLFLQEHNVLVPEKDLDTYEMIESVFERNNPSTAFYIINLGEIIRQYKLWRELFPYIEPRYAVKCNPNKVICQLLSILGVGFDVASKNEINLVKDYVNDMDKVIYANPYKESSSIQYARSIDVDSSVFDSEDELYKIKTYHPKCKLLMRIKVDDKNSLCKFSEKFGVDINDEAEQLLTLAKYMNLNVVGVSFHVGSGCMDATQYYRALEQCKMVFDIYGDLEDSKYATHAYEMKDSYDGYGVGAKAELLYEGVDFGLDAARNYFGVLNNRSIDTQYTYMCYSSKNIFGCSIFFSQLSYSLFKKQSKQ